MAIRYGAEILNTNFHVCAKQEETMVLLEWRIHVFIYLLLI